MGLESNLGLAGEWLMKQRGLALAGVVLVCALMAASTMAVWFDLAQSQRSLAQRHWLWHSQAAAEAVLKDASLAWPQAAPAPISGCLLGRCAWQGSAGLTRSHWLGLLQQAAWGGCSATATFAAGWPTLPGARLACWIESTPHPDGTLVRMTAWVQDESLAQATVMQSVWQAGASEPWLSWREVLP